MRKKLTRREFLKKSAVTLAAATFPSLPGNVFAQSAGKPRAFVVLQLTGGLDPLLAFPYTTDTSKIRGNLSRIAPTDIKSVFQAGTNTRPGLGVHPGLTILEPFFPSMKVIMQTGNAMHLHPDLSHDIAQLYMATGGIGGYAKRVGWTARLFDKGVSLRGFHGVRPSYNCETCKLPPLVTSTYEALKIDNVETQFNQSPYVVNAQNTRHIEKTIELLSGYTPATANAPASSDPQRLKPSRHISAIEEEFRKSQRAMFHALDTIVGRNGIDGTLSAKYQTGLHSLYDRAPFGMPAGTVYNAELGIQFRNIAQTLNEMKAKNDNSNIIFVLQLDGFDLHENWLPWGNNLMWSLGWGLRLFLEDLKAAGLFDNTAIFCTTEFGRTILSTEGGVGSDHGVGYSSIVLGGKVNGGVYGNIYNVNELELIAKSSNAWPREVPQERVIAEILQTHMGIDPKNAFPGDYLDTIPQAKGLNLFRA